MSQITPSRISQSLVAFAAGSAVTVLLLKYVLPAAPQQEDTSSKSSSPPSSSSSSSNRLDSVKVKYDESLKNKRRLSMLLSLARAGSSSESLESLLNRVVQSIGSLLGAKAVSIYLVDPSSQTIVVCASNEDGLTGFPVAFGEGIAGMVALKALPFRDIDSNCGTEKQYLGGELLLEKGIFKSLLNSHKTMLCVPVCVNKLTGLPTAVIQAIDRQDNENFDDFDEESLIMLAEELSLAFKNKAVELRELQIHAAERSAMDTDDPDLRLSFLREYGLGTGSGLPPLLRQTNGSRSLLNNQEKLVFIDFAKNHSQKSIDNKPGVVRQIPLKKYSRRTSMLSPADVDNMLSDHNLDPFIIEDDELVYLAGKMLDSYGLIERYNIVADDLRLFFQTVRNNYHKPAFHNFKHGWGTLHLTYQILRHGTDEKLLPVEIFAVLMGAICHDLDHPGNNNAFEVATRSDRATLYGDDTVLERHHLATALMILMTTCRSVLGDMSSEDVDVFRKNIIAGIMATDMAKHFTQIEYLHQWQLSMSNTTGLTCNIFNSSIERLKLAGVILHCADIGAQTQTTEVSLKWSDAVLVEFRAQAQKEKEFGLPMTPFMQGLDDELTCMQLQQGFVANIVVPLWSGLSSCFPNLEYAVVQATKNMNYFADRVNMLSRARTLSMGTSGRDLNTSKRGSMTSIGSQASQKSQKGNSNKELETDVGTIQRTLNFSGSTNSSTNNSIRNSTNIDLNTSTEDK